MQEDEAADELQVREKSARCSDTLQNDDSCCKVSALVSGVGDVITLAGEAIHEVFAPPTYPSAALRVYGGPLFDKLRHEWTGTPPTERPIDDVAVLDRYLEELTPPGSLADCSVKWTQVSVQAASRSPILLSSRLRGWA